MRDYELVMVLDPLLEEGEAQAILDKVSQWVEERGGSLVKKEMWGRRKLAYPIKRNLEGNYALANFKIEHNQVKELEANLKLSEAIIRHLLVRKGD